MARSRSDRDSSRCSFDAGGSREMGASELKKPPGILRDKEVGVREERGRMQLVRNADTDFVL